MCSFNVHNILLILLFVLFFDINNCRSQSHDSTGNKTKNSCLSFQTGLVMDAYNSAGLRVSFEYQEQIRNNWYYGILYENKRHLFKPGTDNPNSYPANSNLLCMNGYYMLKIWKDRVYFSSGIGIGIIHLFWDGVDQLAPVATANLTLNIKLFKGLWIETSPLVIFPPVDRGYFALCRGYHHQYYAAMTFFPIGFKVALK